MRKASGSFFVGFMRFRFVAAPGARSGNIYGFSEEGERDYGQDETHLSRDLRGGGAKSPLWRKIVVNVMDMPVDIPQTEQGPAFGAAMLAMGGCGGGAPGQGDSYGGSSAQSSSGSDSEAFPGDTETGASGDKNEEVTVMYMYIGGGRVEVTLAANGATAALTALLRQGDIVYTADDYGGFEQVGALGHSLPESNSRIDARPGDVMLYQGNQIVVFYGSNSWSYTPVGRIQGLSAAELEAFLGAGQGEVQIRLSLH